MEIIKNVFLIILLIPTTALVFFVAYIFFLKIKEITTIEKDEWYYNEYKKVSEENKQLKNDLFELSQQSFNNQKQK